MYDSIWSIWKARNKFYFENKTVDPLFSVQYSIEMVANYQVPKNLLSTPRTQSRNENWVPPPADVYKLNVDAAVVDELTYLICKKKTGWHIVV